MNLAYKRDRDEDRVMIWLGDLYDAVMRYAIARYILAGVVGALFMTTVIAMFVGAWAVFWIAVELVRRATGG